MKYSKPLPLNERREGDGKPRVIEEIIRHPVPARDYFIAEDDGGRRFWLFRAGLYGETPAPAWYLHGFFS